MQLGFSVVFLCLYLWSIWIESSVRIVPLMEVSSYFRLYPYAYEELPRRRYHSNSSIIDEWMRLMGPPTKFHSNDSTFINEDPFPVDYLVNRNVNVCSTTSFLIMLYPIRLKDFKMRQLLRQAVPQNAIIRGKRVNRVFVIAIDDNDRESIQRIRNESRFYGDIIISRHVDAYSRIAKSVWDGLMWIREHCSSALFAGKFDPDAVVFLGNLVSYLERAPTQRYYGGREMGYFLRSRGNSHRKFECPNDYPYDRYVSYVGGPAALFSMDVVDYLVVGAEYEPLFIKNSDDIMLGALLNRVGIRPHKVESNCTFMILHGDDHGFYKDYRVLPDRVCVYHHVKSTALYAEIIEYYGNRVNGSVSFC